MKILLAADGSSYTKKALGWLVTNQDFTGSDNELLVVHVQAPVPPRVRSALGSEVCNNYYEAEARKVTSPIEKFLKLHKLPARVLSQVGSPSDEILRAAKREKVHQIVMGTHGRGLLGRALMGSVAQRVLAESTVPVLLVR
jgi:nucleotide-binding universal stress UspA family protein